MLSYQIAGLLEDTWITSANMLSQTHPQLQKMIVYHLYSREVEESTPPFTQSVTPPDDLPIPIDHLIDYKSKKGGV